MLEHLRIFAYCRGTVTIANRSRQSAGKICGYLISTKILRDYMPIPSMMDLRCPSSGEDIVRSPWRHGVNTQNKARVGEPARGFILNKSNIARCFRLLVDLSISIEYSREMTLIPSWCQTLRKDEGY